MSRRTNQNRKGAPPVAACELLGILTGDIADLKAHANALFGSCDPLLNAIVWAECFGDGKINVDTSVCWDPQSEAEYRSNSAQLHMAELLERCAAAIVRLDDQLFDRIADLIRRVRRVREGKFADPLGFYLIFLLLRTCFQTFGPKTTASPDFSRAYERMRGTEQSGVWQSVERTRLRRERRSTHLCWSSWSRLFERQAWSSEQFPELGGLSFSERRTNSLRELNSWVAHVEPVLDRNPHAER
jgi:hypothetical protein